MKNIVAIAIIFIFLFRAVAFAQTSIKAEVNKTSITADETLTYKISISSSEKQLPLPQLPKFEGFDVVSQTESSQISFGRDENKTVILYEFILTPTATGKLKLEPTSIKIKNKTYSTQSFEIEIKPGKTMPKVRPEEKPSRPEELQPETEEPQITL